MRRRGRGPASSSAGRHPASLALPDCHENASCRVCAPAVFYLLYSLPAAAYKDERSSASLPTVALSKDVADPDAERREEGDSSSPGGKQQVQLAAVGSASREL